MKVVHLPTSVGGNSVGLAQGERALGLLSDVVVVSDSWLQYPADRVIFNNSHKSIMGKAFGLVTLVKEVYRVRNHYDVFHFNFGTSLIDLWKIGFPLLDLPFYKSKGKVVVTYNGCDARQKYPTVRRVSFSACHDSNCYNGICQKEAKDKLKKRRISKYDRYADAIFAVNPDLMYFLPKRTQFLPYTIANWAEIEALPYKGIDKKLKIAHSTTNRAAKGSEIIMEALHLLKNRYGDNVEVFLIENMPHQKARQIYAEVDLAIDQILVGWYGAFAVEVMKMGKPVMVFIRKEDLQFLPEEMARDCQNAIIQIDPFSIFEKLCEIIENPSILKKYREAALEYVYKWHDPVYVASITKSVYES